MDARKLAPYEWSVMDRLRLTGDESVHESERWMSIHLRYTGGADFFSGATIALDGPEMSESEFDEYSERFLRENEQKVLKYLAGLIRAEHETSLATGQPS